MKKRYRIIEIDNYDGKTYKVQKKSVFGFWYNYENIDGSVTGIYDNIDEARNSIMKHAFRSKSLVKECHTF